MFGDGLLSVCTHKTRTLRRLRFVYDGVAGHGGVLSCRAILRPRATNGRLEQALSMRRDDALEVDFGKGTDRWPTTTCR